MALKFGVVVVAVVLLLVPARMVAEGTSSPTLCPASTAKGAVRAYYRALNQHRAAVAKACLTSRYLARLSRPTVLLPDWTNVLSAHIVQLIARRIGDSLLPPDVERSPYRAVQVGAQVRIRYRRIGGMPNGVNTFFIYVVKRRKASPWRIAEIGGGP
jgi:hypothetical protein